MWITHLAWVGFYNFFCHFVKSFWCLLTEIFFSLISSFLPDKMLLNLSQIEKCERDERNEESVKLLPFFHFLCVCLFFTEHNTDAFDDQFNFHSAHCPYANRERERESSCGIIFSFCPGPARICAVHVCTIKLSSAAEIIYLFAPYAVWQHWQRIFLVVSIG